MKEQERLVKAEKPDKRSLSKISHDFIELCDKIDDMEEVEGELVERFMNLKLEHKEKVDSWIYILDQVKSRTAFLKDRKKRLEKAYKLCQNLEIRMKEYLRFVINNTSVPLNGNEGRIYLHGSAEKVDHNIKTENKSVYNAVDQSITGFVPDISPYLKEIKFYSLDVTKIKEDLKAGKKLSFAKLTKSSHIRVRS